MADPYRVRMSGPLTPFADGFAVELTGQGYTRISAACQLRLMAHLSRWLASARLDAQALSCATVDKFLSARRAAGYTNYYSPKALAPLLEYLRSLGATPPLAATVATTPAEALLERYRRYLTLERGLTARTARSYVDMVQQFVVARITDDGAGLARLTAGDVIAFILAESRRRPRRSAKLLVTALRSLLRFLHVTGTLDASLQSAVPAIACWRLAGLPTALEPEQLRRLLASCDRRTITGRRNFAILLLLARLGLRAGEVASLQLDDIAWRAGVALIRGKGNREERIPLPADVGQAVAAYLQRGRPASAQSRHVFVRIKAPHRGLTAGGVTGVVYTVARRAGLARLSARRLRQTAATRMLHAGASLSEIAQVLRHRRLATTAIYAKVDRAALRTLSRPWPEV